MEHIFCIKDTCRFTECVHHPTHVDMNKSHTYEFLEGSLSCIINAEKIRTHCLMGYWRSTYNGVEFFCRKKGDFVTENECISCWNNH